ncbi:MAG: hypothetical protein ACQER7_06290, partial [Bacteroidota bacterium]
MQILSNESERRKIYFNKPQRIALHVLANTEYHVWARRTGKSHGLTGIRSLQNVISMPRSMGAFIFPTYKMGLAQILPNIKTAWEFFGYKEGLHYIVNKRPPKKWGWETPFFNPSTYEHVISWFNGSAIMLISQDRLGTSNSVGFDWVIGDEAKFLNYDRIKTETIPAISGTIQTIKRWEKHPRFRSQLFCTDMPILKKAQWIFEKEKEVDQDRINLILYHRKKQAQTKSKKAKKAYQKIIDQLRSEATFYSEASTLDNIKIVGEKYIRDQKRSSRPFEYRTQILNKRPNRIENGFYNKYNPKKHDLPIQYNNELLDSYDYDLEKLNENLDCRFDNDIDTEKPLAIGEDHNADINSLVTGQAHYEKNELWFLKSMYVKMPMKFSDLMKKWVKYYEPVRGKIKEVVYYYDQTSIKRSDLTEETNADVVIDILSKAGWDVEPVYLGKTDFQDVRYDDWSRSFDGENGMFPRYHKYNCYDLIVAMQQTGIKYTHSRAGWGKDKSQEHKFFETEQTQPHLTDAMDTLKRGCEQMPYSSGTRIPL